MTRFENVGVLIREKVWLCQALSLINPSYLSAYEDGTECSETSAYKIQAPGDYPEESIQHSEQGKSYVMFKFL